MKRLTRLYAAAALMALVACGDQVPENSGVTAEEAEALNEAEAMLDESADPAETGELPVKDSSESQ